MEAKKWPHKKIPLNGLLCTMLVIATCAACGASPSATSTLTPAAQTPAVSPVPSKESPAISPASTSDKPAPTTVPAQTAKATAKPSDELLSLVATVEEAAKSYPTSSIPGNFPDSLKNSVGTPQRKCVDIEAGRNGDMAVARSGEFILQTLIPKYTKAAWSQWHLSETTLLTVKAFKVGDASATLSFGPFRGVIGGWGYPSAIDLPAGATWLLVATADVNWGCFIVTMP